MLPKTQQIYQAEVQRENTPSASFQTYSPLIAKIEVKRRGDVRRAKLYYLRGLSGKKARIKEKLPSRVAKQLGETATTE